MIPRFPYLFLVLFLWLLVPYQEGIAGNSESPCSIIENQEIVPLAWKYRTHIWRLIEVCPLQVDFLQMDNLDSVGHLFQSDSLPKCHSDPCYCFMSLQL